ncbi:ferritin [Peribacillus butanolivorans]|uniref:Ferritin n=1 Tax=Peribacillus butanolivorans TaxID=421767 RepID=A0AAX0S783_9BACI|nr:ferritin [Peribacillus butanolivorans]AXN40664.1 ferritin [Peribacillus butanolivorans]PEJ34943.1 ferritin [Peribacillus butanolivorans]
MLNEQIQKLLNNLIGIENLSSTLYLAMSAYMATKNYTGMANWLRLQSEEERTHMLKLIDYVTNRGGKVEIQTMPTQPTDFGSPLETFKRVLEHEKYVTDGYRQALDFASKMDSQTAILFQDFLREQVDEEAQSQTIVDRLNLAQNNPSAILLLDQELGQRKAPPATPAG